jgi:hypothetical protein
MNHKAASPDTLLDDEFLRRVEAAEVERFDHRDHLRMAFLLAKRDRDPQAVGRACRDAIRRLAAAHGQGDHYHETITRAWAQIVVAVVEVDPGRTFAEALEAHPELGEADYLLTRYSRGRLVSDEARRHWVEPDLAPLPTRAALPSPQTTGWSRKRTSSARPRRAR